MEASCEILQFLHYHPLSSHEEIRAGINFHELDNIAFKISIREL